MHSRKDDENCEFGAKGLSAKEDVEMKWERAMGLHLEVESEIEETDERIADAMELEDEAEFEEQEANQIVEQHTDVSNTSKIGMSVMRNGRMRRKNGMTGNVKTLKILET